MGDVLPDVEHAVVPEDKLRAYILNPEHSSGTNKLRVIYSALAIGPEDWEYMREQLVSGVANGTVVSSRLSVGCTLYEVPVEVEGLNGAKKRVRTIWKVLDEGGPPTLVTAYLDQRVK